jgi:predicted SAM-dependent methyltransferase
MEMLNLGCGKCFHSAWVNVDFSGRPPDVLGCDLRKGIPFASSGFQVVYHSHLLEHFPRELADGFLEECYRVLAAGGVLRVVVPDLERIVTLYLERLNAALGGQPGAEKDYDWLMLELYDQTVRSESGGAMKRYLERADIPNRAFVASRMGSLQQARRGGQIPEHQRRRKLSTSRRLPRFKTWRERLTKGILGAEYEILKEGRFRRSGEVHLWMYDRFSLARLLRSVGFVDIRRCEAGESAIPNWDVYRLDLESDGSVRKPDSLFMECRKPG